MRIKDLSILASNLTVHQLSKNPEILSDSNWECDPTGIHEAYYSEIINVIILTQGLDSYDADYYNRYYKVTDFKKLDFRRTE